MTKTRIYLDVDGVINAIPAATDKELRTGWPLWNSARVSPDGGKHTYLVTWALGLIDALHALGSDEDVEIVWLTTWKDAAPRDLSPALNLQGQNWPVLTDSGTTVAAHGYVPQRSMGGHHFGWWWKASAITTHLEQYPIDKVVWIDDDHDAYSSGVLFVLKHFSEIDLLLITPSTEYGMTQDHIKTIHDFLSQVDTGDEAVV